jgi:acyl-CoA thioesterase
MEGPAFFTPDGDDLVPHPEARGPWSDQMLHGRLLAALAARAIEREQLEDGFVPARLTVDLFRAAPMRPVQVSTITVRRGGRVKTAEVRITVEDREVARATTVMLKTGPEPPGRVWSPAPWSVPSPEQVDAPDRGPSPFPMDMRVIGGGGFGHLGPKHLWVREVRPLVEGELPSGLARAAGAADLANPFGNSGEEGLHFINADVSLHLARPPAGEWIGLDVSFRSSRAGVAAAGCDLYDQEGLFGACSVASVATARLGAG